MNDRIMMTPYSKLLFVDMEMVRGYKDVAKECPRALELWQYKKRDKLTEKLPTEEEAVSFYNKESALNPIFGKIVCISLGVVTKDEQIKLTSLTGPEDKIIKDFVDIAQKKKQYLVAHNGRNFDFPYARQRASILGIPYLKRGEGLDSGVKPWELEDCIIDTMHDFRGTYLYQSSLADLAFAYGLPNPKDEMMGSQVSDVYYNEPNGIQRIVKYCEQGDVKTLINIYRRMRGDTIIP